MAVEMNVGLPGDARYVAGTARSEITYNEGPLEIAFSEYTFPGFNGVLVHDLGARRRRIAATLFVTCSNSAGLVGIEQNLDAIARGGEFTLTVSSGRQYPRTILLSVRPLAPWEKIRSGTYADWLRRDYALEYLVLSGT